jgi:hypothetical protein
MSDCGICIGGGDVDGMIEMLEMKIIRSRKEHNCYECRRPIPKGAECERGSGLWEGKFDTWHTCLDCVNIRDGLNCDGPPVLGTLWEDIESAFTYNPFTSACLAKIETASAKAYLTERWRKWKGLQ